MAVDPAAREQLLESLSAAIGPQEAATMDALLPPDDVGATARFDRIDAHLADHDQRFVAIDQRFDTIEARLDGHDQRFVAIDQRFDTIESRLDGHDQHFIAIERQLQALDLRMDTLRYELIAAFRGEVVAAVSGQTRAVLLGVVTASIAMFGMSAGMAQLF